MTDPAGWVDLQSALESQQRINQGLEAVTTTPGARSYLGVTFTLATGPDIEDEDVERIRSTVAGSDDSPERVSFQRSSIGWGGDGGAVAVVLDGIERFGSVGGGIVLGWASVKVACVRIGRLWRHLRRSGGEPQMSLGAVGYLCLADLYNRIDQRVEVQIIHAGELAPGAGATPGHSGSGELFLYVFGNVNGSWLYLPDSRGRVLHRSESGALPPSFYWRTGYRFGDVEPDAAPMYLDPPLDDI